jgi:hypothetical protein
MKFKGLDSEEKKRMSACKRKYMNAGVMQVSISVWNAEIDNGYDDEGLREYGRW